MRFCLKDRGFDSREKWNYLVLLFCLAPLLIAACTSILRHQPREPVLTSPVPIYVTPREPVADPTIAIDSKGTVYAVWWGGAIGEIFLSRSADGGVTWSPPKNVSNTPLSSDFPVLAISPQDRLYLVWEDLSFVPLSGEVVISISNDGGATWSPPKNISNTRAHSARPNIAVGPTGDLSVVWLEGGRQVFFTRSTDGGTIWSPPKDISGGLLPNSVPAPAIVEDGRGNLFVAWSVSNGRPVITRSVNGGGTWSSPQAMTTVQPTVYPTLAIGPNGTLYAAWSESSGTFTEVVLSRSVDSGSSFSKPVNVSRSPDVPSMDSHVAVDRHGTIICIWHEVLMGNTEIYTARSTDGVKTFTPPVNLSRTPGNSLAPRLVVDRKGWAYTVWEQGVKEAIFFSRIE